MRNFGAPPTFALSEESGLERNTVGLSTPSCVCVFTFYFFSAFLFVLSSLFVVSPWTRDGVPKERREEENMEWGGFDVCLRGDSCLGSVHLPLKI